MFIKREDLVDMLEVIDCENGYVDLDHLVECCNNLPSSGMSVWCMKCENNGECMTIDKPNCFQPRQADTPQTETPCDGCVCDDGKHLMCCMNCKGIAWKTEPPKVEDEPQTDGYMTEEQTKDYRKMLDKAEHKVYGNIEDEPQTERSE